MGIFHHYGVSRRSMIPNRASHLEKYESFQESSSNADNFHKQTES